MALSVRTAACVGGVFRWLWDAVAISGATHGFRGRPAIFSPPWSRNAMRFVRPSAAGLSPVRTARSVGRDAKLDGVPDGR